MWLARKTRNPGQSRQKRFNCDWLQPTAMQDLCYDWLKHAVRFVRSTQKTANLTREESERGGLTPRVTGEVKQFTDKALAAYLKTQVN